MKISSTTANYFKYGLLLLVSTQAFCQVPNNFTCTSIQTSTLHSTGVINTNGLNVTSTLSSSGDISAGQDLNVSGNINLQGNLNTSGSSTTFINGPAVFGNSLQISGFVGGTANSVYVDGNGFLQKGLPLPANVACIPGTPQWNFGGNNIANFTFPGLSQVDIGTCDNTDFILKSNNIQRQWLKIDGTISFGANIASNTNGKQFNFDQGVIRLSGPNSYGGPQIVFDGGISPFGDWGIEYLQFQTYKGLNFWKPSGSPNAFNYLLFLDDDGRITVGAPTEATSARFNVDGWNGDGIRSKVNDGVKAYTVLTKTAMLRNLWFIQMVLLILVHWPRSALAVQLFRMPM